MGGVTVGSAVAVAILSVLGTVTLAWINNTFIKRKTKAETDGIIVDAATNVVSLLKTQLQEMSVELKAVKEELIKTQAVVKHLEMKISEYERGIGT